LNDVSGIKLCHSTDCVPEILFQSCFNLLQLNLRFRAAQILVLAILRATRLGFGEIFAQKVDSSTFVTLTVAPPHVAPAQVRTGTPGRGRKR
jgi:hypothetical protein